MASKARPSVTAKSSKGRVSTTLASGHPALPPQLLEIYSQTISSLRPRPPSQPHHRHGSAASSHRPRVVIAQKEPEALQEDLLVAKSTINALNQDKKMLTVKIRTLEHEIDNLDRRHEELLTINMLVGKGRKVAGVEDKIVSSLRATARHHERKAKRLEAEVTALQNSTRYTNLVETERECKTLQRETFRLHRLLAHSKNDSMMDFSSGSVLDYDSVVEQLMARVRALEAENLVLRGNESNITQQHGRRSEEDWESLNREKLHMERSLGESIIRERRLTTRIKECEEEMHQLREQHEQELRNRVEESQESIVSPTEVMQDLRARYESALVDLSHHQDLSSQLQAEMTALRVDIQKGDRVRQEMSVVLESTQRELESCRGDLNTSQVQVVELKAECSALRSEIAAVTQKLQDQKEDASPPSHAPAGAPLTPISPQHQPTPNHLSSDPQIPAKAFSVSNLFVTEPPPEETPFPFSRAQTPLSLSAIEHKTDSVKSTKEVSGPVHSHAPDTTDISSVPTHQTNIPNPPDLPTIRTPTPSPPPVRGVAQPFDFLAPDANFHPPRTTSVTTLKSRACPNDRTSNPLLSQLSPPLSNPTTTASTEHVPDESLADLGTPRPIRHQPRSASVTSIKSEAYTTPSGSVESFVPTVVEPVLAQPVLNSDRLDESSTAMQNEAAIAIQTQIRGYLTRKRHPIPATAVAAAPKMATATSAQAIYDASLLPEDTVSSSAPVVEDTKIKSRTPSPVPSVIESLVESLEGFTDSESDDGSESADDLW